MNKQRFTKVLREPGEIKDELNDLQELQKTYPYCQSIHVLLAILYKQKKLNEATQALNYAAMYVADRQNLRDLISHGISPVSESAKTEAVADETNTREISEAKKPEEKTNLKSDRTTSIKTISKDEETSLVDKTQTERTKEEEILPTAPEVELPDQHTPKSIASSMPGISSGDKMREDLIKNLENLQAAKKEWSQEVVMAKSEKGVSEAPETKKSTKKPTKKKIGKAKDEGKTATKKKEAEKKPVKEIKISSEKKVSASESPAKIKKQQELISKFIENSPSIKAKANNPPIISSQQEDLSIHSTSFKDGLISENLAEILISQGKLDKAIDIYKKLIWKFPQKKAYFAARIEELSNSKG